MYRKLNFKIAVFLTLAPFISTLMLSCATVYHGYLMKGNIIKTTDSEVYLCIGSEEGAAVGQELDVYKVVHVRRATPIYKHVHTGKVKITEIIDEHFAKATVTSGKTEKGDIVQLVRPK